jgi:TetR/AcrR family transcriptional repressor of nem operon
VRSSREDTARHRQEIIDAAARLFREKGVDGVSVPALMQAVGMTHGGFYKHFASKEELVPLAYRRAFELMHERVAADAAEHSNDRAAAWNAMVSSYLSPAHRNSIGSGCAAAALAGDTARDEPGGSAQDAYTGGVERMLDQIASLRGKAGGREEDLAALATLVGALILSRGTSGELSEETLAAAREHLLKPRKR